MKLRSIIIPALAICFLGSFQAEAKSKCRNDFTGNWVNHKNQVFALTQFGCDSVFGTDTSKNIAYDVYMDGKTKSSIPTKYINFLKNKGIDVLQSATYTAKLTTLPSRSQIDISFKANVKLLYSYTAVVSGEARVSVPKDEKVKNACLKADPLAKKPQMSVSVSSLKLEKVTNGKKAVVTALIPEFLKSKGFNVDLSGLTYGEVLAKASTNQANSLIFGHPRGKLGCKDVDWSDQKRARNLSSGFRKYESGETFETNTQY